MNHMITLNTVRYFKRIMRPLAEDGIIPLPEYHEAISQLTSLAEHGIPKPTVVPKLIDQREAAEMLGIGLSNFKKLEGEGALKLIDQREAAEMLGIGLSNFKKLEGEGAFPFKRKMVGSSVRYRNTDLIDYIISSEEV